MMLYSPLTAVTWVSLFIYDLHLTIVCLSIYKYCIDELVLIVTGTVTDVPQTSPHLVSGVIIVYVIDNTALLQQAWYGH
jgi:hypothetical protein